MGYFARSAIYQNKGRETKNDPEAVKKFIGELQERARIDKEQQNETLEDINESKFSETPDLSVEGLDKISGQDLKDIGTGIKDAANYVAKTRVKESAYAGLSDYKDMSLYGLVERKGRNAINSFSGDPITKEEYEASPYYHKDIPYTKDMTMQDAESRNAALHRKENVEKFYQEATGLEKVISMGTTFGLFGAELAAVSAATGGLGAAAGAANLTRVARGIGLGSEILGLGGSTGKIATGIETILGGSKIAGLVGKGVQGGIQMGAYETALRKGGGLTNELIKEGDVGAKERENADILMAAGGGALIEGAIIPGIKGIYKGFFKSKKIPDINIDAIKNELILNELHTGEKAKLDLLPNKSNEIKIDGRTFEMPESIFSKDLDQDVIFNHAVRDLDDIKHITEKSHENIEDLNLDDLFSPEGINTFKKGSILTNADGGLLIGEQRLLAMKKMFAEGGELLENYLKKLEDAGIDISKTQKPILTRILETPLEKEQIKLLSNVDYFSSASKSFDVKNGTAHDLLFPESISSSGLGKDIKVKYAIVDLKDLVASHIIGTKKLNENSKYNQEFQPRDRERAASYDQVTKLADEFDGRKMIISVDDTTGMPIVDAKLNVLSGNGRKLILEQLKNNNNYQKYIDALDKYGIDTQGLKYPVAVRILDENLKKNELLQFIKGANDSPIAKMSETEQAISDAKHFIEDLKSEDGLIKDFVKKIPRSEVGDFVDASGALSVAGKRRLEAALLQKAFNDDKLTALLFENLNDQDLLTLRGVLKDISFNLVKLKEDIAKGHVSDIANISNKITDAFYEVKNSVQYHGNTLGLGADLAQKDMFTPLNPLTEAITRSFFENESFARKLLPESKLSKIFNDTIKEMNHELTNNNMFGSNYNESDIGAILDKVKLENGKESIIKYQDIAEKTEDYIKNLSYDLKEVNGETRLKQNETRPETKMKQPEENLVKPRPAEFDKYNSQFEQLKDNAVDKEAMEGIESIQKQMTESMKLNETLSDYAACIMGLNKK